VAGGDCDEEFEVQTGLTAVSAAASGGMSIDTAEGGHEPSATGLIRCDPALVTPSYTW
jgi:hypothetical protein